MKDARREHIVMVSGAGLTGTETDIYGGSSRTLSGTVALGIERVVFLFGGTSVEENTV
jgi:hypothetical protein